MTQTIEPFICLNDFEYMDNFSEGWHSHGKGRIPVEALVIGYPITDWSREQPRRFDIVAHQYTVGQLMRVINEVVCQELAKGNNFAPHYAEDYCIERITVKDGVAEIQFGS